MKNKFSFLFLFIILAFILNFVWENLHFFLYAGNNIGIDNYWLLMLYASSIDAFYISLAFIFIILLNKKINWNLTKKNLILFVSLLIIIAVLIEIRALSTGRWVYSSSMPTVLSIGISPLIQLAITGLLSLFLARKIVR